MEKRKILIQMDCDPHASVFDRVVAIDAGVDEIFSHGGVKLEDVEVMVHGAIFTRGPKDLKNTALFVGGSKTAVAEAMLKEARKHMLPHFGLQVSILLDPNGANTTAAAAVRAAGRHINLAGARALVLGATGPVGLRAARLLAGEGAHVRVGSRRVDRAEAACQHIAAVVPNASLEPVSTDSQIELTEALEQRDLVIAAGAAGILVLPRDQRESCSTLKVVIDLNAVPPLGIEGVDATDKGKDLDGVICYGAIGVGDTKMKVHRAAVAKLFESNQHVLDAEEVYEIAKNF